MEGIELNMMEWSGCYLAARADGEPSSAEARQGVRMGYLRLLL